MSNVELELLGQGFNISTTEENPLINWTKAELTTKAQSIVYAVSEGLANPLEEYIKVRKGKEILDEAEKNLKPYLDGLTLNKNERYFGCEIVEKENGVKYDYTACNDPEWTELNAAIVRLSDQMKEREKFLKGISKPFEQVNTETGETFTINPPVKTGKLGKSVTIK